MPVDQYMTHNHFDIALLYPAPYVDRNNSFYMNSLIRNRFTLRNVFINISSRSCRALRISGNIVFFNSLSILEHPVSWATSNFLTCCGSVDDFLVSSWNISSVRFSLKTPYLDSFNFLWNSSKFWQYCSSNNFRS